MAAYADLVRFTSISTGTGGMVLQAVVEGYQAPSSAIFDSQVVEYTILHPITPLEKETGIGTWSNATQTLTRLTPRATSSFSTAPSNALVPFSAGTKTITFGLTSHGIALVAGGGATLNQVASAPGTYDFVVGGQYNVVYADRRHAYLKVLGPSDGLLTATMYIALPDPAEGPEGYRLIYEKGESSLFNVVGVGFSNPVAVSANVNDFLTFVGYTPADGDPFILRRGTAPGGLSLGIVYFARDSTGVTCKAAATLGGSAIDITSAGGGFVAFRGRKSLTRIDQYQGARIVGTTVRKWEIVEGSQQSPSSFGQDLMKASNAAAAQALLGPVTSIDDGAVVLADLQADALGSLADTRPGVVDVLSGLTLVTDLSPPSGLNSPAPGQNVISLQDGGSSGVLLTPSFATAGEITVASSGAVRFNVAASNAYLVSPSTQSYASDYVTVVFAGFPSSVTNGSFRPFGKINHGNGFGVQCGLIDSLGNFTIGGYSAPATQFTIKTIAGPGSGKMVIVAFSYHRATGALRVSYNWGARYDESTVAVLANWAGQTTLELAIGSVSTFTFDVHWFGTKEYTSSSLATRAQLEALVRDMEQHAARKIGYGDLALPLLQTIETTAAVPRGIGSTGDLKSAWVSGFGVTGSSPITGVVESHGLATSLIVSGSPGLQSDGAIRIVCNGATSSGLLAKNTVPDLLTTRNILVMDVNCDILGDWNAASLFRAFDSGGGFGFIVGYNGIAVYTAAATTTTSAFTPKRGRQRIGLYVELAGPSSPSSFRYISVGRDQNAVARPPLKVAATFATTSPDPSGQGGLHVWVGEGNLIAGRLGTHDIYGWRLLKGVPAGLSADTIDALLDAEIKKLGRESDPLLRTLPVPIDVSNLSANINAQGFFLYNQSIGLASAIVGTTANVDPLHRGRLVPLSNGPWTLTITNSTPPGDYSYKDTSGDGGFVVGGASVTLYTLRADGDGLEAITTPNLKVHKHGRVWFRVEENSGSAPIVVAGGDLDVPTVFTDPVTFVDTVKVGTQRGTSRDIGNGATISVADSGKVLFTNSSGSASVDPANTLAPGSGDTFLCTVIHTASGTYTVGAGGVALAQNEAATIVCRFGSSRRVYKSSGTVLP